MKKRNHSRLLHVCTGTLLLVLAMVMFMSTAMAAACSHNNFDSDWHNGTICKTCNKDAEGKQHTPKVVGYTPLSDGSGHVAQYECCGYTWAGATEAHDEKLTPHTGKNDSIKACSKCYYGAGNTHIVTHESGYFFLSNSKHGKDKYVCTCAPTAPWYGKEESHAGIKAHGIEVCSICKYDNGGTAQHIVSFKEGLFYVDPEYHATREYSCSCGEKSWYEDNYKVKHTFDKEPGGYHNGTVCSVCKMNNPNAKHEFTSERAQAGKYFYVDKDSHATVKNTCTNTYCDKYWYTGLEDHDLDEDFHNGTLCKTCMQDGTTTAHKVTETEGYFWVGDKSKHATIKYTCTCRCEAWYGGYKAHSYVYSWHNGEVCEDCLYGKEETPKKHTAQSTPLSGPSFVNNQYHAISQYVCNCNQSSGTWYGDWEKHDFTAFYHDGTVCQDCGCDEQGKLHDINETVNADGVPSVTCTTCGKIWTGSSPEAHKHTYDAKFHKGDVCMGCFKDKDGKEHDIQEFTDNNGKSYTSCLTSGCNLMWETIASTECKHVYDSNYHFGEACKICLKDKTGKLHDESIIVEMAYLNSSSHAGYQRKCSVCNYTKNELVEAHTFDSNWHNGAVCKVCQKDAGGTVHAEMKSTGDYVYVDQYLHATGKSECKACSATWFTNKSVHSFSGQWHNGKICMICKLDEKGNLHNDDKSSEFAYLDDEYHAYYYSECTFCEESWYDLKGKHTFNKDWHNGTICEVCMMDEKGQTHSWNKKGICDICDIKLDENFTGLNSVDGYYYINGERCELTGLVTHNGVKYHIVDGKLETKTDGLTKFGDTYYFFDEGMVQNITDLVAYDGGYFFVVNGVLDDSVSGLQLIGETFYFLANGQMQNHYGFALYDGEWFYLNGGKLDTKATGLYNYDGGTFFIAAGRLVRERTGLAQTPNGDWYYVIEGQVQTNYTGPVKYDGATFNVVNGKVVF